MTQLIPGQTVPDLDLPLTIDARFELSKQQPEAFTMLVFYRASIVRSARSTLPS